MKTFLKFVGVGLIGGLNLCGFNAQAMLEVGASVQINSKADFDVALAGHGAWVEVSSYGHCWHPAGVAMGWWPYCDGQWIWTDCGWYWESDEPWAWACYHYGTWVHDPGCGWCWVPGIEWAPAWVEWRIGGGFVGWAPYAPPGVVVAPGFFGFVEVGHFHERVRPQTVIVNNTTIINQTTVINNVRQETRNINGSSRRVVVNEGPGVEPMQKATGRNVSAIPIVEAARRTSAPSSVMYKPVRPASEEETPVIQAQPRPPAINESPRINQVPPKSETQPKSPPKQEHPAGTNSEIPPKEIFPNAPPANDRIVHSSDWHPEGRIISRSGPTNPSTVPPKPFEPAGVNSSRSQYQEKDKGHEKDKP
jgi:hypothetical protein